MRSKQCIFIQHILRPEMWLEERRAPVKRRPSCSMWNYNSFVCYNNKVDRSLPEAQLWHNGCGFPKNGRLCIIQVQDSFVPPGGIFLIFVRRAPVQDLNFVIVIFPVILNLCQSDFKTNIFPLFQYTIEIPTFENVHTLWISSFTSFARRG